MKTLKLLAVGLTTMAAIGFFMPVPGIAMEKGEFNSSLFKNKIEAPVHSTKKNRWNYRLRLINDLEILAISPIDKRGRPAIMVNSIIRF